MTSSTFNYPPIPSGATFPSQLHKLAEENPDKPAYIFFDARFNKTTLTRKDVLDRSRKFAAILHRRGVKKGDIVCNTLVNSPDCLLSMFSTWLAGGVSMHGQVFLADGEDLIHNCRVAQCSAIIVDPGQAKGALGILNGIQYTDERTGDVRYSGLPDLKTVIHFRACTNNDEEELKRGLLSLDDEKEMFEETDVTGGDCAVILCTSGTTGFSKLVAFTHKRCLYNSRFVTSRLGVRDEDFVCFNMNNLGWGGGFPGAFSTFGCTRVLTDLSRGVPEKAENHVLRILNEVKVGSGLVVPMMINKLRSGALINNRARMFSMSGALTTKELLGAIGLITDSLNNFYGMTECGGMASKLYEEGTPFEENCVGKAGNGAEIKVMDEKLKELPSRKVGQLALRGPCVMKGYVNNSEKTKECFTEGHWFGYILQEKN